MSTTPQPPVPPNQFGFELAEGLQGNPLLLLLLALLAAAVSPTRPPAPAPSPAPPPPPVPPVAPSPPPTPPASIAGRRPKHRINGGKAIVTGMLDMTRPRAPRRLSDAEVDAICAGADAAPRDVRIETDCTPSAEDGYVFGPYDPEWNLDPQPGSVDDEEAAPMRLIAELSSGLSGGLRHEYVNFGCDCWLRVSGDGAIGNLRYVGPDYGTSSHAEIPLTRKGSAVDLITVGT
jgi:hypothetical protein